MTNHFLNRVLLLAVICAAAFLLLANLGNQYLWQDEAETALVSKTILTDGIPRGYDGRNYFSQLQGRDCDKNYVWCRHTWLPFYVLAGFYKIFGVTTFISRLPFAIFGLGTIVLTYFFAEAFWQKQRVSITAAALLTLSVAFMLLCRQCRYYSMVMFFSMLSLYAYVLLLNRKKCAGVLLFVASTLLFHSQHIYLAALFPAIFLHAVIFHRPRLKPLIIVISAVVLFNAPWFIWLTGINFAVPYGTNVMPAKYATILMISDIVHYVFPAWLLLIPVIAIIARWKKAGRAIDDKQMLFGKLSLPIFFIIFNMATILIVSPFPFFRYLGPSIPLLVILMSLIIAAAADIHIILAVGAVIILVTTSQLRYYLYEITHDFDGPNEGICKYLNEHGSNNDVVAITYEDMPLKFYTKMRIIGGLTGEDLEPAKNAKWVIIRKYDNCVKDLAVKKYLIENVNFEQYYRIVLDYPDTLNENREYPGYHYFGTQTNEDKVVIYERID